MAAISHVQWRLPTTIPRMTKLRTRSRLALTLSALVAAIACVGSSPAYAAQDPYAAVQERASYTVYTLPSSIVGLTRTSAKINACGDPSGPYATFSYGKDGSKYSFGLSESPAPGCLDGPGGRFANKKISLRGARVTVAATCPEKAGSAQSRCWNGTSTSAEFNKFLVTNGGYMCIVLPAKGKQWVPTLVELYTMGLSLSDIARVINSLTPYGTGKGAQSNVKADALASEKCT